MVCMTPLLSLGMAPVAFAGPPGSFAFESLLQSLTASQAALGGLHACSDPGPEALRANPAGLATAEGGIASASHRAWQSGLRQEWVGGLMPVASGALAVEVSALHTGSLPAFGEDGTPQGSFSPVEMVAGVGWGGKLGGGVEGGLTAHALYLRGGGDDLSGIAFGAGLEFMAASTRFAIAVRNVGPDPRGDHGTYRLPGQVAVGMEQRIGSRARLDLTATMDRDRQSFGAGGVRVVGPAGASILCGVAYLPDVAAAPLRFQAGLTVPLQGVLFGYSYSPSEETGSAHQISLQYSRR
jgi:hypothetical protein